MPREAAATAHVSDDSASPFDGMAAFAAKRMPGCVPFDPVMRLMRGMPSLRRIWEGLACLWASVQGQGLR